MSGRSCPDIGAHLMSAQATKAVPTEATAPAPGERRSPLAFIIDEEANIRQFVSLILQGSGVDTIEFAEGASFDQIYKPQTNKPSGKPATR